MTDAERIDALEKKLNALITKITLDKFYSEADINGCRETNNGLSEASDQARADIDFIAMETGVEL